MAFGPAAGIELVDSLASETSLKDYHLLPSVRGASPAQGADLPERTGREWCIFPPQPGGIHHGCNPSYRHGHVAR